MSHEPSVNPDVHLQSQIELKEDDDFAAALINDLVEQTEWPFA